MAHRPVFLFIITLLFASCATVLNGPTQTIRVTTGKNIRHISIDSSMELSSPAPAGPYVYVVRRNKAPLVIHLDSDSGRKTVLLKSRNSFAWWFNIYCNDGLGMLVDRKNPKRYGYPPSSHITLADTTVRLRRSIPVGKGSVRLSLATSVVNVFNLQTRSGRDYTGGIFGIEAGLDYFYTTNRYLSFSAGAASSAGLWEYVGAGTHTLGSSLYLNAANNHVIGGLDMGYGISFSRLQWRRISQGIIPSPDSTVNTTGLGASFSASYRITNQLRVGILYQPTFWSMNHSPAYNYQDYISLRLAWKIPLNRRNR